MEGRMECVKLPGSMSSKSSSSSQRALYYNFALALAVRLALMGYGVWQDSTMAVKYTDIDYTVFTDAAEYMTQGDSPYRHPTYRYTPLLAGALVPNILMHHLWGKILFIVCDVVAGYLIYRISLSGGSDSSTSLLCSQLWLYNPLPITVASRGNAESIMSVLTLATVHCLGIKSNKHLVAAAVLYGLSVHVKIYPVTYALPIYLFLSEHYVGKPSPLWSGQVIDIWPNMARVKFVAVSVSVFVSLTGLCYYLYGWEFVYQTYLYHVVRKDIKHNFSPYFYMMYLTGDHPIAPFLGILAFIPQVVLLLVISYKFYRDLPLCCFLQIFIFVSFNKVCTSQYFLWYLTFLPLLLPRLKLSKRDAILMIALWFLGQGLWLAAAYYLEFEGKNTFLLIWAAGLGFLIINVWLVLKIISNYHHGAQFQGGKRVERCGNKLSSIGELLFPSSRKDKKKHGE